ncbi:MAG: DNA processing protein, partial [Bacteroidia bacterium]
AVVGSRRASAAGLRLAGQFSADACRAGLHVCSGLALGVDGAAHTGALDAGGKSVAVMATGIDRIYPRRHHQLARRMVECGALVSEFPPGTPPHRYNFPRRNRIISGLALGVLVVEAALPSGSLITAGTALKQGREVFALPWSNLHAGGRGCLQLIRDGACMVQGIDDILEELGPLFAVQQAGVAPAQEHELFVSGLLVLLGFEAITLDELVQRAACPVAQVLRELSSLELDGSVMRVAGGYIRT